MRNQSSSLLTPFSPISKKDLQIYRQSTCIPQNKDPLILVELPYQVPLLPAYFPDNQKKLLKKDHSPNTRSSEYPAQHSNVLK